MLVCFLVAIKFEDALGGVRVLPGAVSEGCEALKPFAPLGNATLPSCREHDKKWRIN